MLDSVIIKVIPFKHDTLLDTTCNVNVTADCIVKDQARWYICNPFVLQGFFSPGNGLAAVVSKTGPDTSRDQFSYSQPKQSLNI